MKTIFLIAALSLVAVGIGSAQPSITTQPQSQTNIVGSTTTFWVVATGTEPLAYQWQKFSGVWTDLAGYTGTNLVLASLQTSQAGDYRVVITNVDGAVASDVARLTVIVPARLQFPMPPVYKVAENVGSITLAVLRTGDTNRVVSVDYATTSTTALAGLDYVATNGTLFFPAGVTNQMIAVTILNDGLSEGPETFRVNLSSPSYGAVLGTYSTAYMTITDNDTGLQLELPSYSVNEDAGTITVRVLRRDDGDFPVSVDYATTSLTAVAGQDYLDTAGTLTFAPGEILKPVTVTLLNDAIPETNKTFRLTLRNPSGGGVLGTTASATITITDTDELVAFQSSTFAVREDTTFARIAVSRGESERSATVEVATADGTAIAGHDYTGITNALSFAPAERLKYINVPILNDSLKETSETFRIALRNPTGGAMLGSITNLTVTILDNDPGVGFPNSTITVSKGQSWLNLRVARGNDGWVGPFTVDYQTTDGTAQAGIDYQSASGTLKFEMNEMFKVIPLLLLSNPVSQVSIYFTVTLSNLTGEIPFGGSVANIFIQKATPILVGQAQPPLSAAIRLDQDLFHLSWQGSAVVSRSEAITGPWEQLGTNDSPLLARAGLPGAFYQLRSPRPARVYVPSTYNRDTPLPLVLVLHGYGLNGGNYLDYFKIEPLAEERGFLVCHPEGTLDRSGLQFWNATEACCDFYSTRVDDSAYLRALIEEVARQYKVDRKRIYLIGHSNGGFMAYRMACDHSDLIAGIASLAGMTFLDPNRPRPSQPVNVLHIHGTADQMVPYGGGLLIGLPNAAFFPGAITTVQTWAAFNGCQESEWDTTLRMDLDLDSSGLDASVLRYKNCPPGGAVELWTINGGQHVPTFFSGTRSSEFSARVIDWLLAHPKP